MEVKLEQDDIFREIKTEDAIKLKGVKEEGEIEKLIFLIKVLITNLLS